MPIQMQRLLTFAVIVILLAGTLAAVWIVLSPAEKDLLGTILNEHPALILSAAFLFPFAVIVASNWVFRHYIEPLRTLVDEIKVMNLVNPSHRLRAAGSLQVRELSTAVNRALDRIQELQANVDEEVRNSRRTLEEEKIILEALVQDFSDGVIVCNLDGQILLYNREARETVLARSPDTVLSAGGEGAGSTEPGYVGLGRSVFGFISRDLIAHALERIDRNRREGRTRTGVHFVTTGGNNQLLRAEALPVLDSQGALHGYVLLLKDISSQMERDRRRDALLASLMDRLRSSLTVVRTAAEVLAEHPGMAEDRKELLTGAIQEEALSLSGYLDERASDPAAYFNGEWPVEEMLCSDMGAAVKQQGERSLDVHIGVQTGLEDVLVKVDGFTMLQALVHLVDETKRITGTLEFQFRALRVGALAHMDILWKGRPLPAATLRAWEGSRIRIAGQELPVTLAEALARHDAELWSAAESGSNRAYLRVVLPAVEAGESPVGRRTSLTLLSRPEFYDFDLFALADLPRGRRPLAELTFTAFDTETTGLRPSEGDEIVSIGAVRIVNGRMLRGETFDQLIDPRRRLPAESTRVHGIDDAMLRGQPTIATVLPAFSRFAQETVLVGHNAAFDMRFFQIKEELTGVSFPTPVLDTLLLSAIVHPHHDDHTLEGIAGRLGVNLVGRHTALGDAMVTGELFLKLLPLLADKGIRTLQEAVDASKKTYLARVSY
jgi:DNA polymerase-3 subunit epsilon